MLLNLSNHPSAKWPENQIQAASQYGGVTDMPFPHIDPEADTDQVRQLAEQYEVKIRQMTDVRAVHIMGELTFCFALIPMLQNAGIPCVASTTARDTLEHDGIKTSVFRFIRFRAYTLLS